MLRIVSSTHSLAGSGRRSIRLWLQKLSPSQCVGGCNPLLKAVLSLRNGELVWRRDYATYRRDDDFVAAIEEWTYSNGELCCCYAEDRVFDSLSLVGSGRCIIVAATLICISTQRQTNCLESKWS